jgi:hypothetical protein
MLAQWFEQLITDPKFEGSNPAIAATGRKSQKEQKTHFDAEKNAMPTGAAKSDV